MKVYALFPVQEIAIGRPKFGVWIIADEFMAYVRTHKGSIGDALARGIAYAGGITKTPASAIKAWEDYLDRLNNLLNLLDLPPDFLENLEEYIKNAEKSFIAPNEEISVKRGKGALGGEGFEGLIPIELKTSKSSIKFRIHKEVFENEAKPLLEILPIKSYKETRFWLT